MDFVLNGRVRSLDASTVTSRVAALSPDAIRTHWVEIDGRRWPPKQAFRIAAGLVDEPFTSHRALSVFKKLGFATSGIPKTVSTGAAGRPEQATGAPRLTDEDAMEAFRRLDAFMASNELTATLANVEAQLRGIDKHRAEAVAVAAGFDEDLVDSALVVRERVGMLDTLIHAAVITQVLSQILEDGETVTKRPSLGAGNDPDRLFDLETTRRVAEFKLSSWKGHDGARQRGLFADVVGLSLDDTGRRREVYVVGARPKAFLTSSGRNAVKTLSKGPLKTREAPGLTADTTVAEFTAAARIKVVDLTELLPGLR